MTSTPDEINELSPAEGDDGNVSPDFQNALMD